MIKSYRTQTKHMLDVNSKGERCLKLLWTFLIKAVLFIKLYTYIYIQ